ncbi:sulfotransferase [Mucilaginibacter gotjawali]|uniref:Uncharacterized protein n=2 Tax=Mucilaginibacter gotjawali TaxID=1550579 RepID=A0A0X8X458_9SPHI|nr:sulfotransferase [Mucilaginibacter gotjawali]MBB3057500.1 hypothetical protein [Mucilaginibacter gotjawali]BAU55380.1 hypothetical protein MgSA37_03564 [Mucilaginibacter gotjawali]
MDNKKIFCIGLSRTGTTSIDHFLQSVGIKSIHFPLSLFAFPDVVNSNYKFSFNVTKTKYSKWRASKERKVLASAEPPNELLNKYDAFSDLPIPQYYKELYHVFPGSKFIYTTRPLEKWLKSMKWMLHDGCVLWNWGYLNDEMLYSAYQTTRFDKGKLVAAYKKHEQDVLEFFKDKPGQLIVIDIEKSDESFNKLCAFLNIETTETTLPRANEKKGISFRNRVNYFFNRHIPLYFLLKRLKKINL